MATTSSLASNRVMRLPRTNASWQYCLASEILLARNLLLHVVEQASNVL